MGSPVADELSEFRLETELTFIAEGAANTVWRPLHPSTRSTPPLEAELRDIEYDSDRTTPPPTEIELPPLEDRSWLSSTLVRLKKTLPHLPSTLEQYERFRSGVAKYFSEDQLVNLGLVVLPTSSVRLANATLRKLEEQGRRDSIHLGHYVDELEPLGLLMRDMTARTERDEFTFEIKPKWLSQSPNAPKNSRRCRTCALRDKRLHKTMGRHRLDEDHFCPLDLVSNDRRDVDRAVRAILEVRIDVNQKIRHEQLRRRLVDFFHTSKLVHKMAQVQRAADPRGILFQDQEANGGDKRVAPDQRLQPVQRSNIGEATTLRDCTLFVRVPYADDEAIEARLGDLDYKIPTYDKVKYWRKTEEDLIKQGWYEGRGLDEQRQYEKSDAFRIGVCQLAV